MEVQDKWNARINDRYESRGERFLINKFNILLLLPMFCIPQISIICIPQISRDITSVPLTKGSAIIFHDMLAHSSHPNTNGEDRFSLIPTYRNARVADDSAVWASSSTIAVP